MENPLIIIARKKALSMAKDGIKKLYQENRLVYKENGMMEYTDKSGQKQTQTVDGMGGVIWLKMNNELMQRIGKVEASFVGLNITPEDIKSIIVEVKGK